jgi:hypothetical protein
MARKDEKIIGFRVDKSLQSRLELAAEEAGISPHEWAKRAAIRELDSGSLLPKLALQSEVMRQELIEIRKDIAVATEGILVSGGKATNEQASRFVKANLKGG